MANNDEIIQEFDADTLKTTAKALGSRARDAALATAGSFVGRGGEAQGRLHTRIIADRLLQGWLTYKGASDQPPTRKNLYLFLRRHFGKRIDDPQLREIVGVPPAPPAPPPNNNNGGDNNNNNDGGTTADPRQGNLFSGNQPSGPPTPPTAPTTPQKQPATSAQPATPAPTTPAPATPAPATPAPAAPAPPSTPPVSTPKPMPRTTAEIQRQDRVSPQKAAEIQAQEFEALQTWQQANKSSSPAPTPTPTPTPTTAAPATPTVAATKAPQTAAAPVPPATAPSQTATQTAAPATAPPTAPPTAPSASINTPDGWRAFKSQMSTLVRQPEPNQMAVMQTLANALRQSKRNTPDRDRMVNYINGLKTNWKIANKVPQLRQIQVETTRRRGRLLREDVNEELPRSTIDQIFMRIAQTLVANSAATDQDQDNDDRSRRAAPDDTETEDAPSHEQKLDDDFDKYRNHVLTFAKIKDAYRAIQPSPADMRKGGTIVINKIQEMTKSQPRITVKQLFQALHNDGHKIAHMPDTVKTMIIHAVKATR